MRALMCSELGALGMAAWYSTTVVCRHLDVECSFILRDPHNGIEALRLRMSHYGLENLAASMGI